MAETIEVENIGKPEEATPPTKKTRKREEQLSAPVIEEPITATTKPKRTYNKKSKKIDNILDADAIAGLAKQIEGIHMLAAQISGIPEAVLSPADSTALASAVVGVCAQYDLSIDGKTGALLQLLGTASVIYIPRYFAFRRRVSENVKIESDERLS